MEDVKVLAKIGDIEITDREVDIFIESLPQEQKAYAAHPQFRDHALEQIVAVHLFALEAEEEKLHETEEFKKVLAGARRDILSSMAINKVVSGITVTDEECRKFYNENPQHFSQGETAHAKHILVKEEEEALKLLEEIASGKQSFEDAAKTCSTCPSAAQGGDLGTFGRGQMVPEFDAAVFTAECGHIVGPVKTQFGYHLIRVEEKFESSVMPYEQCEERIRSNMLMQKQNDAYTVKVRELKEKFMA